MFSISTKTKVVPVGEIERSMGRVKRVIEKTVND